MHFAWCVCVLFHQPTAVQQIAKLESLLLDSEEISLENGAIVYPVERHIHLRHYQTSQACMKCVPLLCGFTKNTGGVNETESLVRVDDRASALVW